MAFSASGIKRLYGGWARGYDFKFGLRGYKAPEYLSARFPETYNCLKPGTRILDLGIGTGLLAQRFKEVNPQCHITGIDISAAMLEQCHKKNIADTLVCEDFQRQGLPFESASFDAVVSSGVFELLNEPDSVIKEIGRVLKDGGGFSFTSFSNSLLGYACNFHSEKLLKQSFESASMELNENPRFFAFRDICVNPIFYRLYSGVKNTHPFIIPDQA